MNQLDRPQKGETVAVMHTNMGDIAIRLFPEKTPKTCENFMTHAKNGYYNGLIFHRVIRDFMIQGGDPTGTGCGGESIWGDSFEDEPDIELRNYRGALSMANAGPGTNGSQFFIVQCGSVDSRLIQQMKGLTEQGSRRGRRLLRTGRRHAPSRFPPHGLRPGLRRPGRGGRDRGRGNRTPG